MNWSVYEKILRITKSTGTIKYSYYANSNTMDTYKRSSVFRGQKAGASIPIVVVIVVCTARYF